MSSVRPPSVRLQKAPALSLANARICAKRLSLNEVNHEADMRQQSYNLSAGAEFSTPARTIRTRALQVHIAACAIIPRSPAGSSALAGTASTAGEKRYMAGMLVAARRWR